MIKYRIVFLLLMIFILPVISEAYDNDITHRDLTRVATEGSNLDIFLKSNLHFQNGLKTSIKDPTSGTNNIIREWMEEGAYAEDVPNCRASSHFHNPLLSWDKSYVTDLPFYISLWCSDWEKYSNITIATGFLSSDGTKASFSTNPKYAPHNWDKARAHYYDAITAQSEELVNYHFAKTQQRFPDTLSIQSS